MTIKDILERSSALVLNEKRCETEEYAELVVFNRDIDEWHRIYSGLLGPPVSPAGESPTEEDLDITKDHGSLWTEQTLYKKIMEDGIGIIMFWPWKDNEHTTIRIACIKK